MWEYFIGAGVHLDLVDRATKSKNEKNQIKLIVVDSFFISFRLIKELSKQNLGINGTLRQNRV